MPERDPTADEPRPPTPPTLDAADATLDVAPNGHESSLDDSARTFDFDVRAADTEPDLRTGRTAATAPRTATARMTGDRFGRYTLRDPLGSGGFGEVWRAWDDDGAVVALKILNRATAKALLGLKTEVRSLLRLGHPGIVAPYELIAVDGDWAFAMEPIDGPPLDVWIARAPAAERAARLQEALRQLTDAVAHLHTRGILHLDLKPSNVLVRPDGRLAVLDFGLAWVGGPDGLGAVCGTPGYIAPEVWREETPTAAADWFAVGAILYRLLSGRRAYGSGSVWEVRRATLAGLPEAPDLPPDVPEAIGALTLRLLDPDIATRAGEAEIRALLGQASPERRDTEGRVGREAELRALAGALPMTPTGAAAACHVHGPSGIGKSHLVAHFTAALGDACRVIQTTCHPAHLIPFAAADGVVDGLVRAVRAAVAPGTQGTFPHLSALRTVFPVAKLLGSSPSAPGDAAPPDREQVLLDARTLLARALDHGPLLIVIDDVQWADADSVKLLADLFQGCTGPLRVLFAGQEAPEGLLQTFRDAFPVSGWTPLALGPLPEAESRTLLRRSTPAVLDDGEADRLMQTAAGNPYLLRLVGRFHARLGDEADQLGALPVALRRSLAELGADPTRLMEFACLAVGDPDREALAACAGVADPRPALHLLQAEGFVALSSAGESSQVSPQLSQLRAAVVDGIAPDRSQEIHAAWWRTLEARDADPGPCAWHAHHAGDDPAAARLSRDAAEGAEARMAHELAAAHWEDALSWGTWEDEERRGLLDRRARSLLNAGHSAAAGRIWQQLATELPEAEAGRVEERAVEALLMAGDIDQAQPSLVRAFRANKLPTIRRGVGALFPALWTFFRAVINRAGPPGEAPPAEARRIDLCWSVGRYLMVANPPASLPLLLRSLLLAERVGDRARAGRVGALLGFLFAQFPGLGGIGARFQRRADERRGDPYQDAWCAVWDAYASYYAADLPSLEAHANRALELLEGPCPGLPWETARAREVIALGAWMSGDLGTLADVAEDALRAGERRGDLQGQAIAHVFVGQAALLRGESTRARRHAEWASTQWLPDKYTVTHFFGTALAAWCDVHDGDEARGLERLMADEARYRKEGGHRIPLWRIDWLLCEARLRIVQADVDAELPRIEAIAAALAKETRADGPAQAAWLRGVVQARRTGQTGGLEAAQAQFRSLGLGHFDHCLGAALGQADATATLLDAGAAAPQRWARIVTPVPGGTPGRP